MDQEDFHEPFHLGISLHACGGATDGGLRKCLLHGAAFVVCPCCLGKILQGRPEPLSHRFRDILTTAPAPAPATTSASTSAGAITPDLAAPHAAAAAVIYAQSTRGTYTSSLFSYLVKAGDFGHGTESSNAGTGDERERRLAKSLVEEDRRRWVEETPHHAYHAGLVRMVPPRCVICHVSCSMGH